MSSQFDFKDEPFTSLVLLGGLKAQSVVVVLKKMKREGVLG